MRLHCGGVCVWVNLSFFFRARFFVFILVTPRAILFSVFERVFFGVDQRNRAFWGRGLGLGYSFFAVLIATHSAACTS